jgi:hypothetical protein
MSPKISSRQGLAGLPPGLPWDQFEYAIVESPAETRWLTMPDEREKAAGYERGLAFGEQAELRWLRRADGKYHLVYISDSGDRLVEFSDEANLDAGEDGRIILWGERETGTEEFFDGRIPEPLPYPSGIPGNRLAVRVRHYTLKEGEPSRTVYLFRCVTVAAVEDGK